MSSESTEAQSSEPDDADATPHESLQAVGRSASVLLVGLVASQILIAVREIFVAGQVGASAVFDTLVVGVGLPMGMSLVLTSGLAVALVPAYVAALASAERAKARRYAGAVVIWVIVGSGIIVLLLELFASDIVSVMGAGLSSDAQDQATLYLRIAALSVLFSAPYGILYGVCQAETAFRILAVSTPTVSAAALAVVILLWDPLELTGYAIAVVVGPLAGLAVLVLAMAPRSILPIPSLRIRGMGFGQFVRHAVPLSISSAILQINIVVDLSVGSRLGEGSVSALRYGQMLINVPGGAISSAWGSAVYPALVGSSLDRRGSKLASVTERGLRYVAAVFTPIPWLTASVAPLAVAVVFGRGAFTGEAVEATASVVVGLAPMLLLTMILPVHVGALNTHRKGTLLLMGGVLNVSLNALFDVVLGFSLGVFGIALSTSLTLAIVLVFFSTRLSRIEPEIRWKPILRTIAGASVASVPVALVAALFAWNNWADLGTILGAAALAVIGAVGLAAYVAIATTLRIPEPKIVAVEAVRLATRKRV